MKIGGLHILMEFVDCEEDINNKGYMLVIIKKIAEFCKLNIINVLHHNYQPQGVSVVALISESHISIHTWPEAKFANCDLYTCSESDIKYLQLIDMVSDLLKARTHNFMLIRREAGQIKVVQND